MQYKKRLKKKERHFFFISSAFPHLFLPFVIMTPYAIITIKVSLFSLSLSLPHIQTQNHSYYIHHFSILSFFPQLYKYLTSLTIFLSITSLLNLLIFHFKNPNIMCCFSSQHDTFYYAPLSKKHRHLRLTHLKRYSFYYFYYIVFIYINFHYLTLTCMMYDVEGEHN